MTVEQLAKIDAREVMSEDEAFHTLMHCENEQACRFCNANKACLPCADTLYVENNGYADAEQAAYYKPHEPAADPREYQTDGPKSCGNYYAQCNCTDCTARDRWYATSAT
jgi:hypothetical protein